MDLECGSYADEAGDGNELSSIVLEVVESVNLTLPN